MITHITSLEKKLRYQKRRAEKHKTALKTFFESDEMVALTTLIPAFICGWQIRRSPTFRKALKQIMRLGLMTVVTGIKRDE